MADLKGALDALDAARGSPKEVRRAFSRFADLTQRLTAAMRTDFSRAKGQTWDAASFPGWNKVTEFFKWLRNHDQHESPLRISVHERRFYERPDRPGELFSFEGTWTLADQLTDKPPDGITFTPLDQATGKPMPPAAPVRIEYQYLLQWPNEAARKRLQSIGTTDVHLLSAACFAALSEYYTYFTDRINT